jgi:cbb3-type cytochrome oxidase maturation protein
MSTVALLIVLSLAIGVVAWAFFVWTVRSGQYEDPEGAKYRMLDDDEPRTSQGAAPAATPKGPAHAATAKGPAHAATASAPPDAEQRATRDRAD